MLMSSSDDVQQLYAQATDDSAGNTPISFSEFKPRFSEPIQLNREDSQAIPFIKFIQAEGRFELNPEAGEFLQSLKDVKLGVVAVCGKYRTGKSYLLNKLFVETYFQNLNSTQTFNQPTTGGITTATSRSRQPGQGDLAGGIDNQQHFSSTMTSVLGAKECLTGIKPNNGFQVSPTINPCTKGLWIWKKLIYSDQNDCPMVVIDTEGLGAFDEDENHDAKIFLLALLLSSLIIYNSVGTIDENALNNLSLVINLSKKIQLRNRQETPEDIDELASIFPTFLWVLRDFTLKLVDAEGNRISSRQYLENALKEQKGCSETVEQKNRIRRLLKHFFQERDCCTLIRPTEKERDLQDLAKMRDSNLRKDFVEQMARLKQKVMAKVKVKVMNGHQLNGPMIVELANSYIQALNQGEVPNIESAWQNVCSFEQERAFKEAVTHFEQQVKVKVSNTFEDIGYGNLKSVLNQIKDDTLVFLRGKFLGEPKQYEHFERKLKDELKKQCKTIAKEVQVKVDQQILKAVQLAFQESIEDKVRRDCSSVATLDQLDAELKHLMTVMQVKFVNDTERVEELVRKFLLSSRLFRVIEQLHDSERSQSRLQLRLLEERVKLSEAAAEKLKEERRLLSEEQSEEKGKMERERAEQARHIKLIEQRARALEERLQTALTQLKAYQGKEFRDEFVQTQKLEAEEYVQVLNESDSVLEEKDRQLETQNRSVNTSFSQGFNFELENAKCLGVSQVLQTLQPRSMEKNLYEDLMVALDKQTRLITQGLSSEFSEIAQNNSRLTEAVELAQKRNCAVDRKLEKKRRYEALVKHCQRLQCNSCAKLYTPLIFANHFKNCAKQQQIRNSNNGLIIEHKAFPKVEVQVEEVEDQDHYHLAKEEFVARVVEIKKVLGDSKEDLGSESENSLCNQFQEEGAIYLHQDELVNIMGYQTLARHQLGQALSGHHVVTQSSQKSSQVQVKFCVMCQGNVWYVNRSLAQLKGLMNRIQRDKHNSEQEQCQIAKWLLQIERLEAEENFQRVAQIVELFSQTIFSKIQSFNLSFEGRKGGLQNPSIINKMNGSKYGFFEEFVQFFEVESNLRDMKNAWCDQLQEKHSTAQSAQKQRLCTNDDEVVVQMTYEDQESVTRHCKEDHYAAVGQRRLSVAKTIPSNMSELCSGGGMGHGLGLQRIQGFGMTGSAQCHNHSTIQLDGEKSLNDNNSFHFVSFFSVAEELLMKKNLLEGTGAFGLGRGSHQSHSRSINHLNNYELENEDHMLYGAFNPSNNYQYAHRVSKQQYQHDENFVPAGSPQKAIHRRDFQAQQPFSSISNKTNLAYIRDVDNQYESQQQEQDLYPSSSMKSNIHSQLQQYQTGFTNDSYQKNAPQQQLRTNCGHQPKKSKEMQSPYSQSSKAGAKRAMTANKSTSSLNKSANKSIQGSRSIHHANCVPSNNSQQSQSIVSQKSKGSRDAQSAQKLCRQRTVDFPAYEARQAE